jgi:hypothetical protein
MKRATKMFYLGIRIELELEVKYSTILVFKVMTSLYIAASKPINNYVSEKKFNCLKKSNLMHIIF